MNVGAGYATTLMKICRSEMHMQSLYGSFLHTERIMVAMQLFVVIPVEFKFSEHGSLLMKIMQKSATSKYNIFTNMYISYRYPRPIQWNTGKMICFLSNYVIVTFNTYCVGQCSCRITIYVRLIAVWV
jgi:hypothetical protein